jgi:hypothetical protein
VANRTLVVESTGLVAGSITYQELEIKKGGSLQGGIYKVGREVPAMPARAPEPQRAALANSTSEPESVSAQMQEPAPAASTAPAPADEAGAATPPGAAAGSNNGKPKI